MKKCPADCSSKKQTSASVDTIESRPGHIPPISSRTSAHKPGGGEGAAASGRAPAAKGSCRSPVAGPSGQVSGDFGKQFMNSLVDFMEQSHALVQNFKNTSGQGNYSITEGDRSNRIDEILSLISQKEKELSILEEQRDTLERSGSRSSSSGRSPVEWPSWQDTSSTIHSSDMSTPITIHSTGSSSRKSCKGSCGHSSTINTEDLMTPPSQRSTGSGRTGSSPYEVESSAYDYTCEQECQAPCGPSSRDTLNNSFLGDDSDVFNTAFIGGGCTDDPDVFNTAFIEDSSSSGRDVFNTAFIADDYEQYSPQQYSPSASPLQQQYAFSPPIRGGAAQSTPKSAAQKYAFSPPIIGGAAQSTPKSAAQKYAFSPPIIGGAAQSTPKSTAASGRSASSCYCASGSGASPSSYGRR